jgi:hypothetical protein
MLIALLALLGVNLIVIVAFAGSVLSRKRWVKRQRGAFRCVIRVADGEIDGLRPKWRRGYGRWVRDILVWTKGPFLFRNELVAVDGLERQRAARHGEVKRLGDHPVVIRLEVSGAIVEVATSGDDSRPLLGPYRESGGATIGGEPTPAAST